MLLKTFLKAGFRVLAFLTAFFVSFQVVKFLGAYFSTRLLSAAEREKLRNFAQNQNRAIGQLGKAATGIKTGLQDLSLGNG